MRRTIHCILVSLSLLLLTAASGQASSYYFQNNWVEVDYWAGSGSQATIIVIDWNNTNGPYVTQSHAWGFRWNGTAYVSDAISAIDAAGALEVTTGYGGAFVNDAFYSNAAIDGDQHTTARYSGWWWVGETSDFGATWTGNLGGITSELLGNGKIEGLNMDGYNWTSATLTIPASAPVPIPGAVWLLGSGLLGLFGIRRKLG